MRALVTGATGFVGSRLVDRLLAEGWTVRAFDLAPAPEAKPGFEYLRGDVRDEGLAAQAVEGVDIVFHLAAALGASRLGEEEFIAVNAGGTRVMLEAARQAGVKRAVHFSSAGVLGHVAGNEPADETHPLDPRDAYDRSKLAGERAALEIGGAGLDVVVVRPGWAYGPGDRRSFKLIRAIARGRLLMVGRGGAKQTPVFVDDLVRGTMLAAAKGRRSEIYNLAGAEVLTVKAMTEEIAAACGRKLPRAKVPLGPTKAAAWVLGKAFGAVGREAPLNPSRLAFFLHPKPLRIDKARTELGFKPEIGFKDGMARTIAWCRAYGWL
ncbi:MAG: NAD-dependent epimerase/dehydratase family protein [Candidatus Aminicenantes bacterium]|nr:NAD-dependent epimerase/dehydratase family protein [Candidatus Aminicenantes bacterium]